MPLECFPYVCIGKPYVRAFAMFSAHALREWAWSCAHKRDDLYPICTHLQSREPACIVWLYYVCSYIIPRHHSQLCSAAHWKACFSVCVGGSLGLKTRTLDPESWVQVPLVAGHFALESIQLYPRKWGGVFTASFGGDVKPSVSGDLVHTSLWLSPGPH